MTHQFNVSAWIVQKVDAIQRINHYPMESVVCFVNTYPLNSDLCGGQCYSPLNWGLVMVRACSVNPTSFPGSLMLPPLEQGSGNKVGLNPNSAIKLAVSFIYYVHLLSGAHGAFSSCISTLLSGEVPRPCHMVREETKLHSRSGNIVHWYSNTFWPVFCF